MKKYIIISKSRLKSSLDKIIEIAEKSSASKIHVGKMIECKNQIDHASFVRESDDDEFTNALEKYGRTK